jgi:hypothetical protein
MREEGLSPEHIQLRLRVHKLEPLEDVTLWQLTVARDDLDGMEFDVARYYYPNDRDSVPVFNYARTAFHSHGTEVGLEQFDLWLHEFRKVVKERLAEKGCRVFKEMHPWEPENRTVLPDHFVTVKDTRRIRRRLDAFLGRLPRAVRIMLNDDLRYAGLED